MNIVCPQCHFARDIPENRLPGATAIATCPRCKNRFKIQRTTDAASTAIPTDANASTAMPSHTGDDPLPPGAVILQNIPSPLHAVGAESPPLLDTATPDPAPDAAHNDEEYRKAAIAAYERQASPPDAEQDNPWEYPQRAGYFAAFYQTAMRVMFAAPRFFAGLRPSAPQRPVIMFYLIVTVLQIVIERFWGETLASMMTPHADNDSQLQQLILLLRPQTDILMTLLLRTTVSIVELFLITGLYYLMLRLVASSRVHFGLIFQVIAYSAAPALLCVVPLVGSMVGLVWGLACSFVGCRYALGLSWSQTTLALAPVYMLGIPFILHVVRTVQGMAG